MLIPFPHRYSRIYPLTRYTKLADVLSRDLLLILLNRNKRQTRNSTLAYQVHRQLCEKGWRTSRQQLLAIKGLRPAEVDRLLAALELAKRYKR